jgi:hypothetical protein
MNTRPVRDPQTQPSREDLERALAKAICAVWDTNTVSDIASAVGSSINNAEKFAAEHNDAYAKVVADRLRPVFSLLWKAESARVFLEPEHRPE